MFSPWWFGPLPEFVRRCWEAADQGTDFRKDLDTNELHGRARRALTVLAARGNEGLARTSLFSTGGEPERSRVAFYNACRILKSRQESHCLRNLIDEFVPGWDSLPSD